MDTIPNDTLSNNLSEIMQQSKIFTMTNGVMLWGIIIIGCLVVVIFLLTFLLVKREKALQLLTFSISATGLKLTYELNKDEKLRLLAKENIQMQNEIRILKKSLEKEKWRSLKAMLLLLLLAIAEKLRLKDKKTTIL